jgi:hypothetical protein
VDVDELCDRAYEEAAELGPEPADALENALWATKRHDAAIRLASHTGWNRSLCLEAAYEASAVAQRLLLEASYERKP